MPHIKRKPKKDSMINLINKYSHGNLACIQYFFIWNGLQASIVINVAVLITTSMKKRILFEYTEHGHQYYLFARTIFQDNKLPLFK